MGAHRLNHNATVDERIDCQRMAGISFTYMVGCRSLALRRRVVESMADVSAASQGGANCPGRSVWRNGVLKRKTRPAGRGSPVFILQYGTVGTVRAIPAHASRSCMSQNVLVCAVRKHSNHVGVKHHDVRDRRIRKGIGCHRVAGELPKRHAGGSLTSPSYMAFRMFIADLNGERESVHAAEAGAFDRIPHLRRLANDSIGTYLSREMPVDGKATISVPLKYSHVRTLLSQSDRSDTYFGLFPAESAGCDSIRSLGTLVQLEFLSDALVGKWLRYAELVS